MGTKILKNIKYWITYSMLLLFFIFGALFYRQPFMALIILLLFVFPIFSALALFIYGKRIEIGISKHTANIEVGNKISFEITSYNPSIFPFLNIELYFTYNNFYYEEVPDQMIALYANPRKKVLFNLEFETSKSGMIDVEFQKIIVTDFLHLFSIALPVPGNLHIPVFPKSYELPFTPSFPETYSDDEETVNERSGQLSRDIKDVREYIPGDLLRDIHWKISAKKDDLFIKEYDRSAVRMLKVLPELSKDCLEETLETLIALSKVLLKQNEAFKILAFSIGTQDFSEHIINSEDDIEAAILKIYYCNSYDMKAAAYTAYINHFGNESSVITILGREVNVK